MIPLCLSPHLVSGAYIWYPQSTLIPPDSWEPVVFTSHSLPLPDSWSLPSLCRWYLHLTHSHLVSGALYPGQASHCIDPLVQLGYQSASGHLHGGTQVYDLVGDE